ncbi:15-hydroxyprostaglandin dehydrogenase [NAD(+)]-like [Melitaea cinxia]|uniref:15-hydroxyprostaglandin dehydrogenase [NAD(+)]-like n=1 Tax=Melitaea cinxia TaxID=113334 RepID=UPI001E2731CD|nr:15-hydroxyprostaglandin dehydrogenase [NAD(+)]-like [Melitaea cinxia]
MDRQVKGKIVAVTGSANGLGLAMVTSFLQQGAKLAILLDMDEIKGNEALMNLKQKYGDDRVVFYKCNVLNDLEDVYQTITRNHKYIDILVNNAGILDEKNIKRTMNINAIAVMEWTVKFYKNMSLANGGKGGTIINVSSIFGYRIFSFIPFYQASKYAVLGFSKSIGHEMNFKKSGVRVVTLCPGLTHTSLTDTPNVWEGCSLEEMSPYLSKFEWQEPPAIGDGVVEIFKNADSGSVWLVEGSRPAEKIDI